MDQQLQEQAQRIIDAAVADGSENSLQFCAYRDGECLVDVCAGWVDFAQTRPLDKHTIIPVYSTSKGVLAVALIRLIAQGKLTADTLVADIWPEFAKNGKEKTRVLHFLNHTSGLHQRFKEQKTYELVADWPYMIHVIEESAPDWEPGTETRYQSLTYGWVTAEIIQRVTGKSFRSYVMDELFIPEGIEDFYFGTTDEAELNAAEIRLGPGIESSESISVCDPLDELMRQPCIRRAALPGFNGIASAHALAKFYDAVLRERYFPKELLKEATSPVRREAAATTNLSEAAEGYGYGFQLAGPADDFGNVFGHSGYGGSGAGGNQKQRLAMGFTAGTLREHPCKTELLQLINY